jgi:hypothetical protein
MRPLLPSAVAVLALLGLTAPASSQGLPRPPLQLELRVGASVPTGEFAERDPGIGARTGPRLEAGGVFRLAPLLGIFGGASRGEFACSACTGVGLDDRVVDTGVNAGLEVSPGLRLGGLAPWLRAGAVVQQLTFTGEGERLVSPMALGYQLGGGVVVPVRGPIRLRPGLHYRSYPAELDLGAFGGRTVNVAHVTLDLGISVHF